MRDHVAPLRLVWFTTPKEKRVIIKAFVDPDWFAKANLDDTRKTLLKQTTDYCVDGVAMAEAEMEEVLAVTNIRDDCSVHFFTWTTGKDGQLTVRDVATGTGSQLILK